VSAFGSLQCDIGLELVSEEMASAEADQLIDGGAATAVVNFVLAACRRETLVDEVATESPRVLHRSVRDVHEWSSLTVVPARSGAQRATARRVGLWSACSPCAGLTLRL